MPRINPEKLSFFSSECGRMQGDVCRTMAGVGATPVYKTEYPGQVTSSDSPKQMSLYLYFSQRDNKLLYLRRNPFHKYRISSQWPTL